jgi:hypothetical protein
MANKDFGIDDRDLFKGKSKFRVNVIKDGDVIYKAELFRQRTFLGYSMGWIFHKNLWEPVHNKALEIEKLQDKIKVAELEKAALRKEAMTLIITFGGNNLFEPQGFSLSGGDSKTKSFNEAFASGEEKPPVKKKGKVLSFDMEPAPPQTANQQKANGQQNKSNN